MRLAWLGIVAAAASAASAAELLHDFEGISSLAAALRDGDLGIEREAAALGVVVRGPTAPDQVRQPLMAELRHRIEGVDVLAGLHADRTMISEGPTKWVGGVGVAAEHARGREALEVRTLVSHDDQWGRIGLELGPRIERRLPGGVTLFIDGKAEAMAVDGAGTGRQLLPGQPVDGLGLIGVAGRTGFAR